MGHFITCNYLYCFLLFYLKSEIEKKSRISSYTTEHLLLKINQNCILFFVERKLNLIKKVICLATSLTRL